MDHSRIRQRQTTLRSPLTCAGIGLHSGEAATITLLPAGPNTGIVFRRTDVGSQDGCIEARYDRVRSTVLSTTLTNARGVSVATVEHLCAALCGLGVDNVVAEVDGPEVPIMDGSCEAFVELIDRAGVEFSAAPRRLLRVIKPVEIVDGQKRAALMPSETFAVAFEIDFDSPAIGRQSIDIEISPSSFRRDVARARTFGFLSEVEALRQRGLALGGSLDNALVIADGRVINSEPLRFADEFVRHKVLDAVGDMALAGLPLLGRYEGLRAGHELNNRLLKALFADPSAWCIESAASEQRAASADAFAAAAF